jgi:Ca2+-binding EF-hand superfamily protein
MFNMFDIDKDGTIDRQELQQIFGKEQVGIYKNAGGNQKEDSGGEAIIMEIMAEVDQNNDNIISYEEFNEALTKRLREGLT